MGTRHFNNLSLYQRGSNPNYKREMEIMQIFATTFTNRQFPSLSEILFRSNRPV